MRGYRMLDRSTFHVEVGGGIAVIYIVGPMSSAAARLLRSECEKLPAGVRHLRVSISDLELLEHSGTVFLHELERMWRTGRPGWFRVTLAGSQTSSHWRIPRRSGDFPTAEPR